MGEATRCARVIVEELITRGVRDVVLAPGSRSAPLAYELFEADKIGLLTLHVRIDERSAGFLALGLAKVTSLPVPIVTTSGTAVANLHPAVLEAAHSHVPLLLLTADRPQHLHHTGANQTTAQRHLFAEHVRAEAHLDDASGGPHVWRFHLARLLTAATGSRSRLPGPVHLNVAFSEPLSPGTELVPSHPDLVVQPLAEPPTPTRLEGGAQTVIVAGDSSVATGAAAVKLAARAGVPLLAEPSSNARRGEQAMSTYRVLLQSGLAEDVERVIVFGHPTLSRPIARLLQRDDVELVVVSEYADWVDPGARASLVTGAVALQAGPADWLQRWRDAEDSVRASLEALLAQQERLTGPGLAARLWQALGPADSLLVGSSNPVRDLDLAPISAHPATVYANRGLSGIDGSVSTAVGVALASERPTHALLGDLTFLHDSNGLIIGPAEPRPNLRIVVANDNGGSIFATLEHGLPAHMGAFERIFGTPHGVDLEALARACGAAYRRIEAVDEVEEVLDEPPLGLEVVEAVVDRAHRRTLHVEISRLATTV
ncbi:MAG TPA: 2-succinyl-5-enolpyruvyl-6-hydroxy-3-cyclohexene-1-carboxylic-acid synthase [Propionibacteriaceae bacterium]|nr:2-succinyl-5-enolpyruvyl-6-hydroxy-3-cyclohexene-1-carboxylic-acid synthase [Propionibacteriaceae bacterium]